MRPCWTRQGRRLGRWAGSTASLRLDLHALAAHQLQAGSALGPSAPVAPDERRRSDGQRVQEDAHPAWMFGRLPMPLTVFAHPTGATITDAGRIHDAQAAIRFSTLFGGSKLRSGGTAQGAIGLAGKVTTREPALFPGLAGRCRGIALRGREARPWRSREWRAGRAQTRWSAPALAGGDAPAPAAGSTPIG